MVKPGKTAQSRLVNQCESPFNNLNENNTTSMVAHKPSTNYKHNLDFSELKMVEKIGLSTSEALRILQKDIEHVLNQFQLSERARKSKSWLRDALHHNSQHTTINWIPIILILVIIILLILARIFKTDNTALVYQAFFIFALLLICVTCELLDNRLRHNEIPQKVKTMLAKIKRETYDVRWLPENYPHLLTPFSPCITLQWTYRDNKLVNLPWGLLVKDDIILIRPGQISPGYCESMDKTTEYPLLHAKEVYGPVLQNANECFSMPKSRKPLENKRYRLLETPYLNNLRIALELALDRPVTIQNQQRHFLMIKVLERIFLPIVLILVIIVNIVKYAYLQDFIGTYTWVELFVLMPVATILPLLPLVFPVAWNFLNCFGMARFESIFYTTQCYQEKPETFDDQEHSLLDHSVVDYNYREVWNRFLNILKGNDHILMRSSNILHILGSLTALCCVDKKGILSWPNPTAEKVFFLHNSDNLSQVSSLANLGELGTDADSSRANTESAQNNDEYFTTVQEVLDLTHEQNDPFKLHFDDTGWQKHLNSLKPLGLAILLNTCNLDTQEYYTKFCSHITCEAMYNENLIPVTNRRCLCALAKEIGFVEQAQKIFMLEHKLSSFRHLQNEMARRDNKYARSLHLSTKLRFPFPHMFAVVVKELNSGSMQLLSQGTADIILDSCIDYWDGHDLCPLSNSDRKKIQDFYQRCSLTAYCTAFAYRPLYKGMNDKLSQIYLELPSDSRHLYLNHRSPTPVHCDCRTVLEARIKPPIGQFYSTDSLLYNDSPCSDISDIESCFEMQCNQVFIGMVTMQYQVQLDMVHLIEQLEEACIRFVHFSKENELRSRVFSEKMGLESGWNCHISLLSERSSTLDSSKALSYSAPSAINLEHSVVKFDTENPHSTYEFVSPTESEEDVQLHEVTVNVNGTSHEWQSLSCLTDSTEQSVPINFDMSNRAKLPRGIDKIRPHIENIDNVPLLVSLFTDCTAASTKEMIRIMQDYGEIICVIGSSANYEAMGIFMQADASIAVEPLYPQLCQKEEIMKTVGKGKISPIDLSRCLNSVSCSLSVRREDPFSIFLLIIEARHYTGLMWNTVQFWLCSCVSVSIMQLLATLMMLPALLTTGQVLWICCVVVPILSVSLMGVAVDAELMKKPQGKKQIGFNLEVCLFVLWCYGAKFLPMMVIVLATFVATMAGYCIDMCSVNGCVCKHFYLPMEQVNATIIGNWESYSSNVASAQHFCVVVIVLQLATLSISFVHREYSIWNRSPHSNILWLVSIMLISIFQMMFTLLSLKQTSDEHKNYSGFNVTTSVVISALLSPLVTFVINEIIKKEEVKVNVRYQRRARLDFGTKLGMNSPF